MDVVAQDLHATSSSRKGLLAASGNTVVGLGPNSRATIILRRGVWIVTVRAAATDLLACILSQLRPPGLSYCECMMSCVSCKPRQHVPHDEADIQSTSLQDVRDPQAWCQILEKGVLGVEAAMLVAKALHKASET